MPARDSAPRPLSVQCPVCHALTDAPCTSEGYIRASHEARVEAARLHVRDSRDPKQINLLEDAEW